MLETLLESFDFSARERQVLQCLLLNHSLPASRIARKTRIKRPTVYALLDKLVDRGLVIRRKHRTATYYSTVPPEMFTSLLETRAEQKLEDVRQASRTLRQTLSSRQQRAGLDISGFEIEVLESYDAVYHQLLRILVSGDFDSVFNPQIVLPGEGKRVVSEFLIESAKSKPDIREILVDGPEADWYIAHIKNKNHQTKRIAKDQHVLSDMILVDDSVIISHYAPPDELAIKIKHPDFYRTQKTLFELLWARL